MAKYSTPGIRFTEIDNSIRTESLPGMGIGAIVMKSNKGPVNQRVVTRNYNEFTEIFGEPETLTDYGHFAAENYFANSTQLFSVRATMGDEQYSQIQFTYNGAPVTAQNTSNDTAKLLYVDNQGDNNLRLLDPLDKVTNYTSLISGGDWTENADSVSGFSVKQKAYYGEFHDIISESDDLIIFKSKNDGWEGNIAEEGYHVIYPKKVDFEGNAPVLETKLLINDEGWEASASKSDVKIETEVKSDIKLYKVSVSVPEKYTLDGKRKTIQFYGNASAVSSWSADGIDAYKDIFVNGAENFYGDFSGSWTEPELDGYGYVEAQRMEIMDWDDPDLPKTYYVDSETFNETCNQAYGLKYTEFASVDPSYALIGEHPVITDAPGELKRCFINPVSAMYMNTVEIYDTKGKKTGSQTYGEDDDQDWLCVYEDGEAVIPARTPKKVIIDMLDQNACSDISDINSYYYVRYYDIASDSIAEKIVKEDPNTIANSEHNEEFLFWLFAEKDSNKFTKASVYIAGTTDMIALPLKKDHRYENEEDGIVTIMNNIVAQPSSFIFNSIDKTYADGYTIKTESEDEPGNGDVERYRSNFTDQLVITSIGPGEYGDDIGISIITTECSEIPALQHQNAFNWKYAYDDEDQVDKDSTDFNSNPLNLTWKKVFRINVYIKNKTQTAEAAWGTGMDALRKDPAESWFVSTDPYAKDAEGNSLYVPNVINGHSEYIYVSRSSVNDAADNHGAYQQPAQTYAIYGLTGGKNSTKNNISEKTAALDLYKDRQRAKFDILFNVDAVDTFNGRQRFAAHQRKIAQIAAARTMDIGVVQVTSKVPKTAKQMLSESKMFSFNNGSYVAEYGGYDKYYNSSVASWIYLPKSVAGACAMAYCDTFSYPWMAPAGVSRGTIGYTNGQLLKLTDDEIGLLYDNNVNTTRDCGSYGVVLWGQKTALKKNSLLNRINIRRCLNYIEKRLENMMTPYLFMQNSVNTRSAARNDIDSFLNRVKAAEGIDRYALSVTQDPEDPTIMNVAIQLWPTSAIEFIDVKIVINRSRGVSVEEG